MSFLAKEQLLDHEDKKTADAWLYLMHFAQALCTDPKDQL